MPSPGPDEIQQHIDELTRLRSQARNWRLATVLGILVIVIGCVTLILSSMYSLAKPGPKQDELKKELEARFNQDIKPELERIAKDTLNDVKRDVEKELQKVNSRSPELIEAFNNQLVTLQQTLPQRGEKVLQDTFGKEFRSRKPKLEKMFPGVTEEKIQRLVDNVIDESHASMDHLSQVLFGQHLKAMNGIFEHIDTIKKTEPVAADEEIASWETALMVFDIVREELRAFETSGDTNAPSSVAVTKKSAATQGKDSK